MNRLSRLVAIAIVAVVLVSPVIAQSSPGSHPLNEDAALALLERILKRDHVYANRISLDCITYVTEETTNAYFQFVLRENHNAKCGGDPETSPALDRYRVYRNAGKIEWLEHVEDKWRRYDPAKIK
jgi:predicted nucleic acid-binding protein